MGSRYKNYDARLQGLTSSRLIYDDGDLRIQGLDRAGSVIVELRFEDVLCVRISDEGDRLQLLKELKGINGLSLVDEQSELISWLQQEGLGTRDLRDAKHYILFMAEEVFDVVSLSAPKICEHVQTI